MTYFCNNGFVKNSSEIVTCTASGDWSSTTHACLPVDCGIPSTPFNGAVEYNNTVFKSIAQYSCHVGYSLSGDSSSVCQDSGEWFSPAVCQLKDCFLPPRIANSFSAFNSSTYKSVAIYSCEAGYRLSGDPELECNASGVWHSEVMPSCEMIVCPVPAAVHNGNVAAVSLTPGSVAVYTCQSGYTLSDSSPITCSDEGIWEGNIPSCDLVLCSNPPALENGKLEFKSLEHGSSVYLSCNSGYSLIGIDVIKCTSEGTWSHAFPYCRENMCEEPVRIFKEVIVSDTGRRPGDTVTYSCETGYKLEFASNSVLTCTTSSTWQGAKPNCIAVTCDDISSLPEVAHSQHQVIDTAFASQVVYTCSEGFDLIGNDKFVCNQNGLWYSDNPPVCEPKSCGLPPHFPLAIHTPPHSLTFGQSFSYACEAGHELIGDSYTECGADGLWTAPSFVCQGKILINLFVE